MNLSLSKAVMNVKFASQFRINFQILLSLFFLLIAPRLEAQKIGVNERGDSIVVYNDGSWRYFDAKTDQDLLSKPQTISDQVPRPATVAQKDGQKAPKNKSNSKAKKPKNKKSTKKAKAKKDKSAKGGKAKKKKRRKNPYEKGKSKKKGKSKASKKTKGKKTKGKKPKKVKTPSVKYTDIQEERFRNDAIKQAEMASQKAQIQLIKYQDLTYDRVLLEDELKLAYTAPNTTDEEIVAIEKKIQAKRALEDAAGYGFQAAQEEASFRNKLIDVTQSKRAKMIMKWEVEVPMSAEPSESIVRELPPAAALTQNGSLEENTSKQSLKAEKELRQLANIIANPPERTCPEKDVRFNEFTGKKMISLAKEEFFFKTPDQMRAILKDRDYLSCKGALANTGGLTFLELEIVIASASASKAYGIIEKGSKLSLKLLDGYTISLPAAKSAPGEVNNLDKTVTYRPRYLLDKIFIKSLEKSEVDQARLVWMTGYEDYEIYDVDFLQHQINCLKGK